MHIKWLITGQDDGWQINCCSDSVTRWSPQEKMMRQIRTHRSEDFDAILVEELKILKNGERHLQRLFPKLRSQPQLRDYFLLELTAVRQRADRLNAVLNPVCVGELPALSETPSFSPAA